MCCPLYSSSPWKPDTSICANISSGYSEPRTFTLKHTKVTVNGIQSIELPRTVLDLLQTLLRDLHLLAELSVECRCGQRREAVIHLAHESQNVCADQFPP